MAPCCTLFTKLKVNFFILEVVRFIYLQTAILLDKKKEEVFLQPCFCSYTSRTACVPVVLTERITYMAKGHLPQLTTEYFF